MYLADVAVGDFLREADDLDNNMGISDNETDISSGRMPNEPLSSNHGNLNGPRNIKA